MATPADQRLLELLDLWLRSLELHLEYTSLDDASYAKIQAWPPHQRPGRWILDLARQKTLALKAQVEERIKMGDAKFAEALETMVFLANLVGLQHIERYIPLAQAQREVAATLVPADPASMSTATTPAVPAETEPAAAPTGATATREMPQFVAERPTPAPSAARTAAKAAGRPPAAAPATKPAPVAKPAPADTPVPALSIATKPDVSPREQVIADAERLLQWGRKWYELAELIARMADRPPLPEVRRILKEHKAALDASTGGP
jgi:hypothetical protein